MGVYLIQYSQIITIFSAHIGHQMAVTKSELKLELESSIKLLNLNLALKENTWVDGLI